MKVIRKPAPSVLEDPTRKTTPSTIDFPQQVRLRAYEIYQQRGPGHEIEDWLQAEVELKKTELTE
jgi:hypothetical protein